MDVDDDLDAMLDAALDDFDSQKKAREDTVKAENDALAAELEQEFGATGGSAEQMLAALAGVMGELAKPNSGNADGEAGPDLDSLHKVVNGVISKLQEDPGATEEEKSKMQKAVEMLRVSAEKPDAEMKPEHVEQIRIMMHELGPASSGLAAAGEGGADQPSEEELAKMMHELTDMVQKGTEAGGVSPAVNRQAETSDSPSSATAALMELMAKQPHAILGPFQTLRDRFPLWLEQRRSAGDLAIDDLHRYEKQSQVVHAICDAVGNGDIFVVDAADTAESDVAAATRQEKLAKFAALLEELQGLGEPPQIQ